MKNTFCTSEIILAPYICLISQFFLLNISVLVEHMLEDRSTEGYRSVGAGFNIIDRTIEKDLKTNLTLREAST